MLNNGDIIFNMPDEKGNIEISIKCHHWLAIGGLQMENEQSTYLKYRVFNAVFLVGIFMSFSCSLMNHLLGMETVVSSVSLACGIVTVGLFITFKISGNYELLSLIVVIFLSFVFFPTMWLINGGTHGSIPYYIIINAGIIALLLTGLKRWIIFSIFALVIGVLMAIEYQRPDLVIVYNSGLIRYIDFAFGIFICLFTVVILIAVLIDGYAEELKKSRQYLTTLKKQNKEIEAKNKLLKKNNAELIKAKEEAEKLNRLLYEEKQKLQMLSITDYLTGTFNKWFITSCLKEEIEASREKQKKANRSLD
ncbi:MAG TPA: hypothetical protein DCD98_08625 [Syntrophomonas sp.]|jgi:hypothetical protein|nr:hypothetical protein [Bacillota bacterium]HAA09815.1 hypothetical protein [Syntrophomonas sp.]